VIYLGTSLAHGGIKSQGFKVEQVSLSQAGKEELALALLLLKDFKSEGRFDPEITLSVLKMAQHLGVLEEFNKLLTQVPPMKVVPR
jgi:hypothetical protein